MRYALRVNAGGEFIADNDTIFRSTQPIDFTNSGSIDPMDVSVYEIDGSGNVTFTDTDISGEHADVQVICNAAWTDEVKTSWNDFETGRMQTRRTEWLSKQG